MCTPGREGAVGGGGDPGTPLGCLASVLGTAQALLRRVSAAELSLPTPCDEFDVRRLLEHMIGWTQVFSACAAGRQPPFENGSPTYEMRVTAPDPVGELVVDLEHDSAGLIASLGANRGGEITVPYRGAIAVDLLVVEFIAECVIHTWDLATALGLPVTFESDVLTLAHDGLDRLLAASFADQAFESGAPSERSLDGLAGLVARSGRTTGSGRSERHSALGGSDPTCRP